PKPPKTNSSTPPQMHPPSSSTAPPPRPSHRKRPLPFFFFFDCFESRSSSSKSSSLPPFFRGLSSSSSSLLRGERLPGGLSSSSWGGVGVRGRWASSGGTERTAWHLGHLIFLPAKRSSIVSCLSQSLQARLIGMVRILAVSHA